jgi:hypothetical protein
MLAAIFASSILSCVKLAQIHQLGNDACAQVGKILLCQTRIAQMDVRKLSRVIDFLEETLGLHGKDLDKILSTWPRLLLLDVRMKLKPIADFLFDEVSVRMSVENTQGWCLMWVKP